MSSKARFFTLAVPFICGSLALANGINPPRPRGSRTIAATCTKPQPGEKVTIQRARVTRVANSGALDLKVGGIETSIQIGLISRVEISNGTPNADGFADAVIEMADSGEKRRAVVKVLSKGAEVRLTGVDAAKEPIEIPLKECREISFRAVGDNQRSERFHTTKK